MWSTSSAEHERADGTHIPAGGPFNDRLNAQHRPSLVAPRPRRSTPPR
ncbi:hypothetical protein D187_002176 [Cystobacter fuscus DSM 2262]|uniref:Uncharacterized protein n=1 Tax=Cystobacter fuscus (strain ATCC 25194 / DSM 2262 / NBRC 100088 / M29) TaxID=1242864 RepID=S9P6N0_CYSF2|nr:hypothetical protein D187_002176 [Cystobacter fuscus DSM 2262]